MQAELVSTGSELLSGRTVNRHAHALGGALAELGIALVRDTTVPDDPDLMRDAVQSALDRSEVVFVSGGLGPTSDDITRDVLAGLLGRRIVMDEDARERIRERCVSAGLEMNEARARQALVLKGAEVLSNRVGAAPGECIRLDGGRTLFVLPGPPAEFNAVLEDGVLPRLRDMAPAPSGAERIFMTCGAAEADIVTAFENAGLPGDGLAAAFCAAPGRVEIRLRDAGGGPEALRRASESVRELLYDHIFAEERMTLAEALGRLLVDRGQTVSVAESCTGGLLGKLFTDVSGSSAWFKGGVIAYANEIKEQLLRVPRDVLDTHGAVSEPVARAMAEGVCRACATEYGIGITGMAGPEGGTPDKPVGLVYAAIASPGETVINERRFRGDREAVRERSAQCAMYNLWRALKHTSNE